MTFEPYSGQQEVLRIPAPASHVPRTGLRNRPTWYRRMMRDVRSIGVEEFIAFAWLVGLLGVIGEEFHDFERGDAVLAVITIFGFRMMTVVSTTMLLAMAMVVFRNASMRRTQLNWWMNLLSRKYFAGEREALMARRLEIIDELKVAVLKAHREIELERRKDGEGWKDGSPS